jgi:hypothetical protein
MICLALVFFVGILVVSLLSNLKLSTHLPVTSLESLVTGSASVQQLNASLVSLCAALKYSDTVISSIATNYPGRNNPAQETIGIVASYSSLIRDFLCAENPNGDKTLCIVEVLGDGLHTFLNTNPLNSRHTTAPQNDAAAAAEAYISALLSSVICSPCAKTMVNVVVAFISADSAYPFSPDTQEWVTGIEAGLNNKCVAASLARQEIGRIRLRYGRS